MISTKISFDEAVQVARTQKDLRDGESLTQFFNMTSLSRLKEAELDLEFIIKTLKAGNYGRVSFDERVQLRQLQLIYSVIQRRIKGLQKRNAAKNKARRLTPSGLAPKDLAKLVSVISKSLKSKPKATVMPDSVSGAMPEPVVKELMTPEVLAFKDKFVSLVENGMSTAQAAEYIRNEGIKRQRAEDEDFLNGLIQHSKTDTEESEDK